MSDSSNAVIPKWLIDPINFEFKKGKIEWFSVHSRYLAKKIAPWASICSKDQGGMLCFELYEDLDLWRKTYNKAIDEKYGTVRPSRKQVRCMPSVGSIWRHWQGSFSGETQRHCFACGHQAREGYNLERAHILAISKGGDDAVENLHILCRQCHQESEALSGGPYFSWLMS